MRSLARVLAWISSYFVLKKISPSFPSRSTGEWHRLLGVARASARGGVCCDEGEGLLFGARCDGGEALGGEKEQGQGARCQSV